MGETKIEWTDATFNPVTGCTKVSPGCDHCFAARLASGRLKHHPRYKGLADKGKWVAPPRCHPELLEVPLHWRKPRKVFVCDMSDLFHDDVPYDFHLRLWDTFAKCQQHTFQLLTKRAERMAAVTRELGGYDPGGRIPLSTRYRDFAENVWLGVTAEDQQRADERLPWLFKCPAAVHFVSLEPLLGPVSFGNLSLLRRTGTGLDQVIVGGETGPGARPMKPDWVRSIRDQCVEAGVPFFFKSHGDWLHETEVVGAEPRYEAVKAILLRRDERNIHFWPNGEMSYRVGKKRAGRQLDGQEWDQFPERSVRCPS